MKKKMISFLMVLCLLAASFCYPMGTANAKTPSSEQTTYVAFGDSIAAGYGLNGYSDSQTAAPADSYQALLADFLKTSSCNYAVTGDDSSDCLELLNSGAADADLAHADVISLSIGSNDLLRPFIEIVMDHFGIEPGTIDGATIPSLDPSEMYGYYQQLPALTAKLSDNETLHAQAAAFPEKFQKILATLHEKAPAAEIYVTNIYDPFASVPMLGDLASVYIREIDQAFLADAADYKLIDIYTPFNEGEGLTNVSFDIGSLTDPFQKDVSINPDPHPSAAGHKAIAELFIQALKDTHAPKAAALSSLRSNGNYKLTAKIKVPADADGCQIRYSLTKKGTYKTLASAPGGTFRTNSGRLRSGRTYYFKARSYKTIKGVTYYGKTSSIKKLKVR